MPLVAVGLKCGGFGASGSASRRAGRPARAATRARPAPCRRGAGEEAARRSSGVGGASVYSRVVNSSRLSSARATPTRPPRPSRRASAAAATSSRQHGQLRARSAGARPGTARTRTGAGRRRRPPDFAQRVRRARAAHSTKTGSLSSVSACSGVDAPVAARARRVAVGRRRTTRERRVRQRALHVDVDAAAVPVAVGHLQRLVRELLLEQPVAGTAARSTARRSVGASRPLADSARSRTISASTRKRFCRASSSLFGSALASAGRLRRLAVGRPRGRSCGSAPCGDQPQPHELGRQPVEQLGVARRRRR